MKRINKTILTTSALLIFTFNIFAQNNFKVGISMGTVIPLGEFKSNEMSSNDAGFSESGFTLNFDGDYYLHHRFAVSARFHFGLSSLNENEVYNWLKDELETNFVNDSLTTSNIGYWQWSAPMIGIKYNYPIIINKLYIETGLFSGLNISPVPTQSIAINDSENNRKYYSENEPGTSLSIPIMFDAGFRVIFNENIQFKLQSSYFKTNIKYEHKNSYQNDNSSVIDLGEPLNIKVPLKNISFSIGLIYSI